MSDDENIYCTIESKDEIWRCKNGHSQTRKIYTNGPIIISGNNGWSPTFYYGMKDPVCFDCLEAFMNEKGFVMKKEDNDG